MWLLLVAAAGAVLVLMRHDNEKFESLKTAYVINLDKHTDRLKAFTAAFASTQTPLTRVAAVDGSAVDWERVVAPKALAELREVVATGSRTRHDQLTPGAVGCYLSHIKVWGALVESGEDRALVFEDDARIPADLQQKISKLQNVPLFDILLLGWEGDSEKVSTDIVRIHRFCRTHAYVITRDTAARLLEKMLPMQQQLDWALSALIKTGLRVFATADQFVEINHEFGTSIQTPLR